MEPDVSSDERTYATLLHLTLLGYLVAPFVMFIAPLIMWLIKKEESRFIDDHGRETLNFHITLMIYSIVLPVIAGILTAVTCGVAFPLVIISVFLPFVLGIVGMIAASRSANRGEYYRYPMTIRFL
ncbi:MAG: DUF4870 domain-containing protein [Planctomycetota bacterium]|nr:MAG: DUF4870 domain-containing protein [Planctomycetota bacterium]